MAMPLVEKYDILPQINLNQREVWDMGVIKTYQKCPKCGKGYPSSKGGEPIRCGTCLTTPTKYFIKIYWKGTSQPIYRDRKGETLHSFSHAVATLGEIRSDLSRKTFDPDIYRRQSKTAFKFFFDKFREGYKGKIGTYDKLKAVGSHLAIFFPYQMRDISTVLIHDWWQDLNSKGLSPRYCNDILQWLKSVFNEAYRIAVIDALPRTWPTPGTQPEPEVDDWLTEEDQVGMLGALPSHDRLIFDFLFLTGVRVNEATGLQRPDTNWDRGITIIQFTRKRDGSLGPTKNKKKRIIPHTDEIRQTLKISDLHTFYQFTNKWGRPYSDDYLRDRFSKACDEVLGRRVKLKNGTRHSWGMQKIVAGWDMWKVSQGYGHSDIKMTEHYVKMVAEQTKGMYCRGGGVKVGLKGKTLRVSP